MATKRPFILLDANILFSSRIRELFFLYCSVADATPFWSVEIIKEWKDNYKNHFSGKKDEEQILIHLKSAYSRMKKNYPKSEIKLKKNEIYAIDFEQDPNDRHVIAAANKFKIDFVITNDKDLKGKVINGTKYISAKNFFEIKEHKV